MGIAAARNAVFSQLTGIMTEKNAKVKKRSKDFRF
jgi:hypothetical protein